MSMNGNVNELNEALREENFRLKQQLISLEEREKANAELLATVSHEVRTPIGAIMTMVELLQTTQLSSTQHHYAQTLQLAAKNLSTLTTDILNFARLEAGHIELEEEAFNLSEFLNTLISAIKPRAEEKGLNFDCRIDKSCPTFIKADQVRLSQIINNLANNALKFTATGALSLRVSSAPIKDSSDEESRQLIRIELKDTGIGMSESEQENIFTPFIQANSDIQTKFGGSGLGLYISRTLAEHMGGELSFKSQKECGSTFWFTFQSKNVAQESVSEEAGQDSENEALMKAHALIVEDNPLNQMLIKTYLDQFGVTYDCVENGQVALNIFQQANHKTYDLILMDIMMPVMDGITTTKELKKLWSGKSQIPIVALTANVLEDQVQEYYKAGVDGYISKPIRGEALYSEISKVLNPITETQTQIAS